MFPFPKHKFTMIQILLAPVSVIRGVIDSFISFIKDTVQNR